MSYTVSTVLHRKHVNNTLVEVLDQGDHRSLYFASCYLQSRMSLSSPCDLILPYTWYMMFVLLMQESPKNVLLVGIGAGSLVRFLHHYIPDCRIDAVDHSAHIINLARGYFSMPENDHVVIHCRDGYDFLQEFRTMKKYDLILIDAFDQQGMATKIYSASFFQLCAESLTPEGILCSNLWSGRAEVMARIESDLQEFFSDQLYNPVPHRGNVIAYSLLQPIPWDKINRSREEYRSLNQRFSLDFREMAGNARKNNLTVPQRLAAFFS